MFLGFILAMAILLLAASGISLVLWLIARALGESAHQIDSEYPHGDWPHLPEDKSRGTRKEGL